MQMDAGLDTGPMILIEELSISADDLVQTIHDQMARLGASALLSALPGYLDGSLSPVIQPDGGVTYADKLSKAEGRIDWHEPADVIATKIRVLNPWPGVWFEHQGTVIKVLDAEVIEQSGTAGQVLDNALTVACGENALRILTLQKAGKGPMDAPSFLRGYEIPIGTYL